MKADLRLASAILCILVLGRLNVLAQGFFFNPSFESNYPEVFPHYGAIDDWEGGSGVNEEDGPFHNPGTPVPDQYRAGFIQGSGSLSQEIFGLEPGETYWLQFHYDARNCCGGTIDLMVRFDDIELDKITNVKPSRDGAPYPFRNVVFTPEADGGVLTFQTVAEGDATVDLDGVTVVKRGANEVPVMNPSFEASGIPSDPDGFISPASMAGWAGEGEYGVNGFGLGPFADNGSIPDQDNAAFVHGQGSLSQRVANLAVGTSYELSFAYNAASGSRPLLRVTVDGDVLFEQEVSAVGGGNPYRTQTVTFTAQDIVAALSFVQVKEGDRTLLLDDIHLIGDLSKPLPPLKVTPAKIELAPGQTGQVTVAVPVELLEMKPAEIQFRSPDPTVAKLVGADGEGVLRVPFDQGDDPVKTFEVKAGVRGVARIEILDAAGLDIGSDTTVSVITSFLRNPSFESNTVPEGVGAGPILSWEGGSGLNDWRGPFQDNGIIPDRSQVAFLQGSTTLSQEILGLKPGQHYWLQFRYNARDCCGGTIDLSVRFDGVELTKIDGILPVASEGQDQYSFVNVGFEPSGSAGLLELSSRADGDATVLIDAVSVVQRDPEEAVIQNPSFEASGTPVGVGYVQPRELAGWEITGGGRGINITGVGPFADNGSAIDQDLVLFLQGATSARQLITDLEPGKDYTLYYYVNARDCCGDGVTRYAVSFDGEILLEEELEPVGGANPYQLRFMTIRPAFEEGLLEFAGNPEGDHTLLIDDVHIVPGVVEPPQPLPPSVALNARQNADGTLRISWPAAAASFVLQSTSALPEGWTEVGEAVQVEDDEAFVILSIGPGNLFLRLTSN